MRGLRWLGRFIWRFMVIFSFIVNIVLVIVLLVLGALLFDIKDNIATPLVTGLHSSFVGLDEATIDWTIPVRDEIPVVLDIPLQTNTVVTLTRPVPLTVNATIVRQGVDILGGPVQVNLQLPTGLELPVALDLNVLVDQPLPVALDVRAVIPLQQTQLHDVAHNLRLLLEPFAIALHNLPGDFGGAMAMAGDVLAGRAPDLLAANAYSTRPWPGYSRTAGLGYSLYNEPVPGDNLPLMTGIVPVGGLPALDELLRPELYEAGGPAAINAQAQQDMDARSVPGVYYQGGLGALMRPGEQALIQPMISAPADGPAIGGPHVPPEPGRDMGIVPTPGSSVQGEADLGIIIPTPEK